MNNISSVLQDVCNSKKLLKYREHLFLHVSIHIKAGLSGISLEWFFMPKM